MTPVNIYVADLANAKINTCDYYSTTTCYQELNYLDCAEFDTFLVERARSRNLQLAVGGWVVQLLVTQMRQIEQMPKPINTHDSTTCSHLLLEYTQHKGFVGCDDELRWIFYDFEVDDCVDF